MYVMNIEKNAYELYMLNRKTAHRHSKIFLTNQNNESEYIILNFDDSFYVIKLKKIRNISLDKNISKDLFLSIIFKGFVSEIKEYDFIDKDFYFENIKELYGYFVNEIMIDEIEFQKYFNTDYSESEKFCYKNIYVSVEKNFKNKDKVKNIIDGILKLKYKDLFDNLLITFKGKITEPNDKELGSSRVSNQYNYNNIINVGNTKTTFNIFHELGHIYQEKYLTKDEIEKIYNTMLQKNVCCFSRDIYLQINNMVPEFFANYYTNELNEESKKFVEQYILK